MPRVHTPVHEHAPSPQLVQQSQWYDHVAYQAPVVEVIPPQLTTYGVSSSFLDPWKFDDFNDPSLQMPSARIEAM